MAREFALWACVLLPWVAALLMLLGAGPAVRVLGPRRATIMAQYLGLGASGLALLFCVQGIGLLLVPDDPRALAHTPLPELLPPIVIGELKVHLGLVGDRLSMSAAVLITGVMALGRVFLGSRAGLSDLGLEPTDSPWAWLTESESESSGSGLSGAGGTDEGPARDRAASTALGRLGLLGLLEGAAVLVVLAGDMSVAAFGWTVLGIGMVAALARRVGDELRASAATRALIVNVTSDACLVAALLVLVLSGIGLTHTGLWAPTVGARLYEGLPEVGLAALPLADLLAALLIAAVFVRLSSLGLSANSGTEALLDAVLLPAPALYLLLRFHRVLAQAPTVLALTLVAGMGMALLGAGFALLRPSGADARVGQRHGLEQGLAGTGVAWAGLAAMAVGVGAWRTLCWLLLAQALGRLGLRVAVLVADGRGLPRWTGRTARLLCWLVAGVAPGLGFIALSRTMVDVLTRNSLLGPVGGWVGAVVVLAVAFVHAAAISRIWYEGLHARAALEVDAEPGGVARIDDSLEFGPLGLALVASITLGILAFGAGFGLVDSPIAWLDQALPTAGGHARAPLGVQASFRDGGGVARPWIGGAAALVTLVTGFAWMWTRERFRRAEGSLAEPKAWLEYGLAGPRWVARGARTAGSGLTQLAAQGVGRGLFEEAPKIVGRLLVDAYASVSARLRAMGGGLVNGPRRAMLGLVLGTTLILGWVYARPEVASFLPGDHYNFGGLEPKLIRAGGLDPKPKQPKQQEQGEAQP